MRQSSCQHIFAFATITHNTFVTNSVNTFSTHLFYTPHLHTCVITTSSSQHHHHNIVITTSSSQHRHHNIVITTSSSQHRHHNIVISLNNVRVSAKAKSRQSSFISMTLNAVPTFIDSRPVRRAMTKVPHHHHHIIIILSSSSLHHQSINLSIYLQPYR